MSWLGAAAARPVRIAQTAAILLLLIKGYFTLAAPPIGDEAYYWMWGQKLAWSYFDHPPLHAWLLRVMSVFGWNVFALRLLTWLTLAGTFWIFWLWAKRLRPEDPAAWWWPTIAIYLSSPLIFLMSSVTFNDHLLIFLCLASAHLFLVFVERWEATGRGFGWLYAAATALGLAVLTKYNGVLFAIGVAAFFALYRPARPLWKSPHLYLAALLSVLLQAPVIGWNITEGFASYNFHLSERWGGSLLRYAPENFPVLVTLLLLLGSPFLVPPIVALVRRPLPVPFASPARVMTLAVFGVSTIAMLALSLFVQVAFYWNIVALVPLMALIAGWFRRWTMYLHLLYGLVFAIGCTINFTTVPLVNLQGGYDWTTSSTFGWPNVAARIAALKTTNDIGFVVASRYTTAAQLGFAMQDPDVVTIAERHDQYDYWFNPADHIGQNALVVGDPVEGVGYISRFFETLTPLETVPFEHYGYRIYEPTIYLGTGFRLPAAE